MSVSLKVSVICVFGLELESQDFEEKHKPVENMMYLLDVGVMHPEPA